MHNHSTITLIARDFFVQPAGFPYKRIVELVESVLLVNGFARLERLQFCSILGLLLILRHHDMMDCLSLRKQKTTFTCCGLPPRSAQVPTVRKTQQAEKARPEVT
eukprot:2609629-Amphidinium_carterae.1